MAISAVCVYSELLLNAIFTFQGVDEEKRKRKGRKGTRKVGRKLNEEMRK